MTMKLSKNSLLPFASVISVALSLTLVASCGSVDPQDNTGKGGSSAAGAGNTGNTGNTGNESSGGAAGGDTSSGASAGAGGEPAAVGVVLLPWAVGNTWTYKVTKNGVTSEKVTTIEAEEAVGIGPHADVMAFHVITAKGVDGTDRTESWQAPAEDNPFRIVRYKEQSFGATTGALQLTEFWDPPKLHIDGAPGRISQGDTWLEQYDETKLPEGLPETTHSVNERWTVLGDNETIEVPAGTFDGVIHLQKVGSGSTKDYWYMPGVGKLKETGSQTEELVEYQVEAP
jgi:hypothetical protein